MTTIIEISGHKPTVSYDPKIGMLRGGFLGLTGGANFYAEDAAKLAEEGAISLWRDVPSTASSPFGAKLDCPPQVVINSHVSLSLALRTTMIFRMTAAMAAFRFLPLWTRRW